MSPRPTPHAGVVVVGTIGVALCCALPPLAALTGIGVVWGPLAALVVKGGLGVAVVLRRLGRQSGDGHQGQQRSARLEED